MVTKCDLVAGFAEYFDDLTQEGRAQVWGVTFPYEQTVSGEAADAFPAEFDALMARLNARLFARLEEERGARRRARRLRVSAADGGAARAADAVRQPTSSRRRASTARCCCAACYFTSGTQDGTPIDRLLGAIGRRFGIAPDAGRGPPGRGKAYFVERLLKDVVIGESGLAGVNRRLELQERRVAARRLRRDRARRRRSA